jgi:hypothetical protein
MNGLLINVKLYLPLSGAWGILSVEDSGLKCRIWLFAGARLAFIANGIMNYIIFLL